VETLNGRGITQTHPIHDTATIGTTHVTRTPAQHGFGKVAEMLAPVSGFVLDDLYIAGDTVFYDEVERTIATHQPSTIVVNAGGATFIGTERLVMDVDDVRKVQAAAPDAHIIAVHLEAINHCPVTRDELRPLGVSVPLDGELGGAGGGLSR
jgi:hypothetical protein